MLLIRIFGVIILQLLQVSFTHPKAVLCEEDSNCTLARDESEAEWWCQLVMREVSFTRCEPAIICDLAL